MEDFFQKNLQRVQEDLCDNDDDRRILKSRQEIEYAQRFLKDDQDQNVYKSKDFNMNRMSVSQLFGKKKVPQAQPVEELKDDEVTDIIDDNEIMA